MEIQLRPYQEHCIEAIRKHIEFGKRRLLVSLPTGAGKTVIFSHYIGQENKKTLVLAHREELLEQAKNKIEHVTGIEAGIVNQFSKDFSKQVVICSIQSAYNKNTLDELVRQHFELCIYDECHRAGAPGSRAVLTALGFWKNTKKILLGFTATPFRHDKKHGLLEVFDDVAYECNIRKLIDDGFLVKPVGYLIRADLDLSSVESDGDDFKEKSLAEVMDTDEMRAAVVNTWKEHALERQTICFGVDIKHSRNLAYEFNAAGFPAALIHGGTDHAERRTYLDAYTHGDIKVLCNAQVLTEGIDLPATSCIILSPTKSPVKAQQAFGRGLRVAPWVNKKDCVFLTFDDKEHKICTIASLAPDAQLGNEQGAGVKEVRKPIWKVPEHLSDELSTYLSEYDPLGSSFIWKEDNGVFYMEGNHGRRLQIEPQDNGMWNVDFWESPEQYRCIADNIDFEFAFGIAEAAARRNEHWFVLGDLNASWRKEPISEKQLAFFKEYRHGSGVKDLTKGQASVLIDSGILKRKASCWRRSSK